MADNPMFSCKNNSVPPKENYIGPDVEPNNRMLAHPQPNMPMFAQGGHSH